MSGGGADELDQALALANGGPAGGSATGPCADCPARTSAAAGGAASAEGSAVDEERPTGPPAPPVGPERPAAGTEAEPEPAEPWLSAASTSTDGLFGAVRPDGGGTPVSPETETADPPRSGSPTAPTDGDGRPHRACAAADGVRDDVAAGRRPGNHGQGTAAAASTPADDDLAAPWLSAVSTSTDGLRGAQPPTAASRPDGDDPAPGRLLGDPGSAAATADAAGNGGALSGVMRALRRPAPAAGGEDDEDGDAGDRSAADDGLLPEWLTRAARAVGLDRAPGPGEPPGPDGTADPDDDLAAPWVPRLRHRPPKPPTTSPTVDDAAGGPAGGDRPPSAAGAAAAAPSRPAPWDRHTHTGAPAGHGARPPAVAGDVRAPATSGVAPGTGERCARVGNDEAVHTAEEEPVADRSAQTDAGLAPARPRAGTPPPVQADTPWDEARRIAARAVGPAEPVTVPLDRAGAQVLAAPLAALADLPSFDTAAMDGWAVAGPGPWTPSDAPGGTAVLAGAEPPEPLADGCAVRIATGARIPEGATAVLRAEHADRAGDGRLRRTAGAPPHSAGPGTDIRPRGQECRTGDRLLPAGTPVTPPVLGLAAAAGYDRLTVTPRPRAEVLVLGNELLDRGLPSEGRIRDALGPLVGPWLTALGAEVLATRRLGDDAEALHEAVTTSAADLVVTTGGTAHGPIDHVRPTLHRIGARLLVDGVEVRPGHPMLLAALPGPAPAGHPPTDPVPSGPRAAAGRHLVGLPGNPLAAVSGLLTLAAPLLRARAGLPEPEPVRATLTARVPGHPRDTRLVPVTRSADGSGATPLRWSGPAMLRGIAGASALAAVPPGGADAGTSVRLLELPW